jgi:hypothetical protein
LGASVAGTGAVVGTALRLLFRHWPVLFALGFAGLGAREFIVLAAVQASKVHGVLGGLVIVLAPIAFLTALILMLRTLRSSLPALAAATAADPTLPADGRPRNLLDHLGSALVPFLAVYASMNYLREDITEYFYRLWVDDSFARANIFDGGPSRLAERFPTRLGVALVSVIVVAVVLRWLLSTWQGRRRWPWLGLIGAYVEVIWLVVAAGVVGGAQQPVFAWAEDRRVILWLMETWQHLLSLFGPLAQPARTVSSWLLGLMGSLDAVIMVPIAWLTVGAVVYGHHLAPPPATAGQQRAARRWARVPRPVRFVGSGISADLRDRFGPLVHGLRTLARAGLAPMLLFCLAFIIAQGAEDWLWELERLLIGPRDLDTVWMPISGPLDMVNRTVGTVLLACLLAAAVDRVLRVQPAVPATDESAGEGPAEPPGAAAASATRPQDQPGTSRA